jgi:hypothetical protein
MYSKRSGRSIPVIKTTTRRNTFTANRIGIPNKSPIAFFFQEVGYASTVVDYPPEDLDEELEISL